MNRSRYSVAVSSPPAKKRRYGLDALRGVAVFLMIEQHVGIWMWRGPDPGTSLFDYPVLVAFNALGGLAAPLFVTLAGLGSGLMCSSPREGLDGTLVRRGVVLMGFGFVLNLLSPSWFSWGSWFVLHMMGFALATTPLWRRISTVGLLIGCFGIFAATVAIQTWLDTPLSLTNPRMRDVSLPGGPFRLAIAEGQFPIFPWLAFYWSGLVSGRWLKAERISLIAWWAVAMLALGGLGYAVYQAHLLRWPAKIAYRAFALKLGFFPPTITIASLLLGAALLLIAGFLVWDHRAPLTHRNPLVTLGRGSLTLLMIHVPVFRDLSRLPPFEAWQAMSASQALLIVFGFFALAVVALHQWQRVEFRYGAEWLLRRLAG